MTFRAAEADGPRTMRLFGGNIEWDGTYKFIGYANVF